MKNINQALLAYAAIREDYFGDTPTKLSLKDLTLQLMLEYETVPFIEFAIILQLVGRDHQILENASKKINGRLPEVNTAQYSARPRKLFPPNHH